MDNANLLDLLEVKKVMKPAIKDMNMAMKILERQLSGRNIKQGLFTDTCNKTRTLNCRNLSARPKCHCWTDSVRVINRWLPLAVLSPIRGPPLFVRQAAGSQRHQAERGTN